MSGTGCEEIIQDLKENDISKTHWAKGDENRSGQENRKRARSAVTASLN